MTHPYGAIRTAGTTTIVSPWLTAEEAAVYCGRRTGQWVRRQVNSGALEPDDRVDGADYTDDREDNM